MPYEESPAYSLHIWLFRFDQLEAILRATFIAQRKQVKTRFITTSRTKTSIKTRASFTNFREI